MNNFIRTGRPQVQVTLTPMERLAINNVVKTILYPKVKLLNQWTFAGQEGDVLYGEVVGNAGIDVDRQAMIREVTVQRVTQRITQERNTSEGGLKSCLASGKWLLVIAYILCA